MNDPCVVMCRCGSTGQRALEMNFAPSPASLAQDANECRTDKALFSDSTQIAVELFESALIRRLSNHFLVFACTRH